MTRTKYRYAAAVLLIELSLPGCNMPGDKFTSSLGAGESLKPIAPAMESASSAGDIQLASLNKPSPIRELQAGESLSKHIAEAPGVVLLDFYADWCGPCRKQSEVIHNVSDDASRLNAQIIKVNVDEHRKIASEYRVSSLPTLMVIRDGQVEQTKTGFTDDTQLRRMLNQP